MGILRGGRGRGLAQEFIAALDEASKVRNCTAGGRVALVALKIGYSSTDHGRAPSLRRACPRRLIARAQRRAITRAVYGKNDARGYRDANYISRLHDPSRNTNRARRALHRHRVGPLLDPMRTKKSDREPSPP